MPCSSAFWLTALLPTFKYDATKMYFHTKKLF